jgi:hypothetical protein
MTLPSLLFALLVASLYGGLYHLVRGGGFWRIVLYCFLSSLGFTIGIIVAAWQEWVLIPFGSFDLGISSIGSLLSLLIGDWLSRIEVRTQSKV